jgi:hypothetical protein
MVFPWCCQHSIIPASAMEVSVALLAISDHFQVYPSLPTLQKSAVQQYQ